MDNNQLIIEALNKLVTNINELNEEMHAMKEVTATMPMNNLLSIINYATSNRY